jgi:hypothetical protein
MKLASSFGRYEEEWKEGDWKVNGEVPVMMILRGNFLGQSSDAVKRSSKAQRSFGRARRSHHLPPHALCSSSLDLFFSWGFRHSLITNPASYRHATPAHTAHQASCEGFPAALVTSRSRHGDRLCPISPLYISGTDRVLARRGGLEHPQPTARVVRYTPCALTSTSSLECRGEIRGLLPRW